MVTNGVHYDFVRRAGLPCYRLKGDPHALLRSAAFRSALEAGGTLALATLFRDAAEAVVVDNMLAIHVATADVDAIISSVPTLTECCAVGQKYQIPVLLAPLLPFSPCGEIPVSFLLPEPSKWAWLNRFTYDLSGFLLWAALGPTFNAFRQESLHIGPQTGYVLDGIPQVAAVATAVVSPRPADWGPFIHTTGPWDLPLADTAAAAAAAHPQLAAALGSVPSDRRARPIFLAFECIPVPDPVAFLLLCHRLSAKTGAVFIFAAGATDLVAARSSPRLEALPGIVWEVSGGVEASNFASTSPRGRAGAPTSPPAAPAAATPAAAAATGGPNPPHAAAPLGAAAPCGAPPPCAGPPPPPPQTPPAGAGMALECGAGEAVRGAGERAAGVAGRGGRHAVPAWPRIAAAGRRARGRRQGGAGGGGG